MSVKELIASAFNKDASAFEVAFNNVMRAKVSDAIDAFKESADLEESTDHDHIYSDYDDGTEGPNTVSGTKKSAETYAKKHGHPSLKVTDVSLNGPGGGLPEVRFSGQKKHLVKLMNHHHGENYPHTNAGYHQFKKDYGYAVKESVDLDDMDEAYSIHYGPVHKYHNTPRAGLAIKQSKYQVIDKRGKTIAHFDTRKEAEKHLADKLGQSYNEEVQLDDMDEASSYEKGDSPILSKKLSYAVHQNDLKKKKPVSLKKAPWDKNEEVDLDEAYFVTNSKGSLTHTVPFKTSNEAIRHANKEEDRTSRVHIVHHIVDGKIKKQWQYSDSHGRYAPYDDNKGEEPRFTREEVEDLDELSKKTIRSYYTRAHGDLAKKSSDYKDKQRKAADIDRMWRPFPTTKPHASRDGMKKDDGVDSETMDKDRNKIRRRMIGIQRSQQKLGIPVSW